MADVVKIYNGKVNPGTNAMIDLGQNNAKGKDLGLSGNIILDGNVMMGDETVLAFEEGKVILGTQDNPLLLQDGNESKYLSDIPTKYQVTLSVITDELTNLNGKVLSNYTSIDGTKTIHGVTYTIKTIKYGSTKVTEVQAKNYMEYMTGSVFLPVYNYEKPSNTFFVMADWTVGKPQYDSTDGLILFKMPLNLMNPPTIPNADIDELFE